MTKPHDDSMETTWSVQGMDECEVEAAPQTIWALLENGDRLSEWAYMVKHTSGGRERSGAVRRCEVEFDGRRGRVTERCAEFVPWRRIAWVMIEDSFGFGRMFADMGFAFTLEPIDDRRTLVRNESFYRPRNLIARVLSALLLRRKFRVLRRRVLANLKALAEMRAGEAVAPDRELGS
jgi:uncharacterized protein YndB with AHSA1/START domain